MVCSYHVIYCQLKQPHSTKHQIVRNNINIITFPTAVKSGPTVLKVLIFIPIIPSKSCAPIITKDNATKNASDLNINNPNATISNDKLLDTAYFAFINASPFTFLDFKSASSENLKLTDALFAQIY